MFKRICATILLAAAGATTATAQVQTFDCQMSSLEGRGFITERLIFSVDTANGRAAVVDGIVMAANNERPMAAEFEQLGNGQYRLRWQIRNLKSGANSFDIDYRLQFRPDDMMFNIRANLRGYDNRPFGTGTCATLDGQSLLN